MFEAVVTVSDCVSVLPLFIIVSVTDSDFDMDSVFRKRPLLGCVRGCERISVSRAFRPCVLVCLSFGERLGLCECDALLHNRVGDRF